MTSAQDRVNSLLTITLGGKGVPYGPTNRDDSVNYGFVNLKSSPNLVDTIPELVGDPELRQLISVINAPSTSLFSVGCVSGLNTQDGRHDCCGYVEFAWNSKRLAQNAASYFPVFFWFTVALLKDHFDRVRFEWEVSGAHFLDAGALPGYTCTVWVNTPRVDSAQEALADWARAIQYLTAILGDVRDPVEDPIYRPAASA